MLTLQVVVLLAILGDLEPNDESQIADALIPEHVIALSAQLDDANFQKRESATDQFFAMGRNAIYPLTVIAESGTPEASVRAFTILQQLYRVDQEPTFEAVEQALQELKQSSNVAAAARAQQSFENNSETRQERAIVQIERLGGIVNYRERGLDRQPLIRPTIEYITLPRGWAGGDAGLQLLGRIDEIRNAEVHLYIIHGVKISEESTQNLRAEFPFLQIQYRGPARLGVRSGSSMRDEQGCVISDVDPGSAAELAGLKKDDVITEIDHQPVLNFQSLIQIIETKEPGEQIPIVFRRGPEFHEVQAELQTWSKQPRLNEPKAKPQ